MNQALENFRQKLIEGWNRHDQEIHESYMKFKDEHQDQALYIGDRKVTSWTYFVQSNHLTRHEIDILSSGPTRTSKTENEKEATRHVENLKRRVEFITGEIIDITIKTTENGSGWYVKGENGNAEVLNIFAGGYNIVRLHVRSLVKKVK